MKAITVTVSTDENIINATAELVQADTALESFRNGGYSFSDAIGEMVDNAIQASARKIRFDWHFQEVKVGKSSKTKREISSLAVADDGLGIPPILLPHVLTVGFSTRYNSRDGIGRYGVGFKLASISQAKRLEIYTCPAFLQAKEEEGEGGERRWTYSEKNDDRRIFMSYLDLDEIKAGKQQRYVVKEVTEYPKEYKDLIQDSSSGTLIVWRKIDRLNEAKPYSETADEKIGDLNYFLARAYRIYIDQGIQIYLPDKVGSITQFAEPLQPYDPTFQIENPIASSLAKGENMKGEFVEDGTLVIEGETVRWAVYMTPKITRLTRGAGGEDGPAGKGQFKRLHIRDNQEKISFLRFNREISYTKVPFLTPNDTIDKNKNLDRFIGIEVSFPPALDEYFQVRHIKRGVEPVNKLRIKLKDVLEKPILAARRRIREIWNETEEQERASQEPENASGGRSRSEETANAANAGMPVSRGGQTVTPQQEEESLRAAAIDAGIIDAEKQTVFIAQAKQKAVVSVDTEWPGKGLLDVEHLNSTILVKVNRRHPFIKGIYTPLKEAMESDQTGWDSDRIQHLLRSAVEGIDLLLFAYAKAESMSQTPGENDYLELREDWGKFTAVYLSKREELTIA